MLVDKDMREVDEVCFFIYISPPPHPPPQVAHANYGDIEHDMQGASSSVRLKPESTGSEKPICALTCLLGFHNSVLLAFPACPVGLTRRKRSESETDIVHWEFSC